MGYVDGIEEIRFIDTGDDGVVSGNLLRFRLDDGSELSQGAVARIRPYDNVLSPAEVAALDQLVGATIPTLSEWGLAASEHASVLTSIAVPGTGAP